MLVVVLSAADSTDMRTKNGLTRIKRMRVIDQSAKICEFSVWGDMTAEMDSVQEVLNANVILLINNVN